MKRKGRNYWTKEKCLKEAKKYKLRSEFKKNSGGAYIASLRNGWLDDVCVHMSFSGNKFKRLVYVYEFLDKTVYVGLTYNIQERDYNHKNKIKSPVFKYINKTGLKPILTFSHFMDVEDAKKLEGDRVSYYKSIGYNVLNSAKTGNFGGGKMIWTKEKCLEEALKCNSRTDFYKKNNSAYNSAKNNGWMDEICSHMLSVSKLHKGYWTREACLKELLKYTSMKDLRKNSPGAYGAMFVNKWFQELCSNIKSKKPNGYWTKERCLEEALKYKTKKEFNKLSKSAYIKSWKEGWIKEICSHMTKKQK